MGVDLIRNPELLSQPEYAVLSSYIFWNKRRLNAIADKNDIVSITVRINGGMNGLSERKRWFDKFYN